MHITGLHVDFDQNINFSPCAWNCICWGFEVSATQFWLWSYIITREDHVLRVYQSIFQKSVNLFPDPVIANFGVLRYQELNYEQKNSSGLTIECLHIDYAKKLTPYLDLKIAFLGSFGKNSFMSSKIVHEWQLRVLTSIEFLPKARVSSVRRAQGV